MQDWVGAFGRGPLGIFGSVIEIGLLSLVVYGIIAFMSGTRGASIGRGLALFLAATFLVVYPASTWNSSVAPPASVSPPCS